MPAFSRFSGRDLAVNLFLYERNDTSQLVMVDFLTATFYVVSQYAPQMLHNPLIVLACSNEFYFLPAAQSGLLSLSHLAVQARESG